MTIRPIVSASARWNNDNVEEEKSIVRTMRLPVAEVIDGGTKQEFYCELRDVLKRCTAAFNRCLTECVVLDKEALESVGRGEKIPKCPKLYTYPVINHNFPGLANVAASIARAAESKYRSDRFEILTQRRSLSSQRSCPMPVLHNKSSKGMKLSLDDDGNVIVSLKLSGTVRYTLRIKGGSNYRRPLRTVKSAIEREAVCDSKIWIDRRGVAVFGIACKIQAKEDSRRSGILKVSTARDAFIVATKEATSTPFTINADHVKRWQAERTRRQQKMRQDSKSGTANSRLKNQRSTVSRKYINRVDSFIEEATAHVIQYANRRRVAKIEFNGTIRSWMPQFPWFDLPLRLKHKCEEHGIEFVEVSSEITPAEINEPHIYFNWDGNGKVKIGKTTQKKLKRQRQIETMAGQDLILLATDKQPKSNLNAREKHYHAMFAECRIKLADGTDTEWFDAEPVINFLREVDCLGNAGNLSQIQQYMEA